MRTGIISATILALLASAATADVTLSIIDATPTARNDGTLPGIGETIFSADVFVDVADDDAWAAALAETLYFPVPGVQFHYTFDPNTAQPILTAPGFGADAQMFSTFFNIPLPQLDPRRLPRNLEKNQE